MSRAGARRGGWTRRWRAGRDEGVETVEIALTFPAMILLVMFILQTALFFHGFAVARSAAQEGARVAAGWGGSLEAGRQAAQTFAEEMGSGEVDDAQVTVEDAGDTVRVTVTGQPVSLVPFWHPRVAGRSTVAKERITP